MKRHGLGTMASFKLTEYIAAFGQAVLQRGARSFEHQFIRRGRMGGQLSPEEMMNAFNAKWAS